MKSKSLTYRHAYEGINYRLRTFAGGRWANYCRPTSIIILMTERCNARCIHCDIWKNRGKEERPRKEEWSKLLEDLRSWLGPVQVVFSGGEALLNLHTVDLVSHASSLGLFVEVLSHGFWENQSRIEALALTRPGRVTISFDGIGKTHSQIRGREGFVEKTRQSIETLKRIRSEQNLRLAIRLKTVIMRQNLDDVCGIARFAQTNGLEVFYQPIEQNYNTKDDPLWFKHSPTWPTNTQKALAAVSQLRELKRQGLPIANSLAQLEAMTRYFADPASSRLAVQSHSAHEPQLLCSALTTLQLQANGDVTTCSARDPIGNIRTQSVKEIWKDRPNWWRTGCCLTESVEADK